MAMHAQGNSDWKATLDSIAAGVMDASYEAADGVPDIIRRSPF